MYRTTSSGSAAARAAIAASLDGINEDSTFSSPDATINAVQEWNSILGVFEELLQHLHDNWVPPLLVKTLFEQLFGFVNVQLFHQLMLRRECCTLSKAECMQAGLNQVRRHVCAHAPAYEEPLPGGSVFQCLDKIAVCNTVAHLLCGT